MNHACVLIINAPHIKCSSVHSLIFLDRDCSAQMASGVNPSWSSVLWWSRVRVLRCIQSPASVWLPPWAGCPVTLKTTSSARGSSICNASITGATSVADLKMVFLFHCACQFKYAFWTQCLRAAATYFAGIWVSLRKQAPCVQTGANILCILFFVVNLFIFLGSSSEFTSGRL